MNKGLFSLKGLCKNYENTPILKNIDLDILEGEFLTLLGPSGCGKTTIIRLLAGFENPDSGEILLQDKNINNLPPEKRAVNTVFQSYALFPHMNIFDNVAFGFKNEKNAKRTNQNRS
ncbi:MAG: ATP-binding cassette domain-containing protein [Aliarcobacter sp.]|nr:ATP-binding cassette domain-containing protein [Aliarcobacter sp.]